MSRPEVAETPLSKLNPAPWNPRTIRDERFKNLCASIQADPEFLWRRPVLATEDGTIYAGNMRYRAAKHLGLSTVPAIIEDVPEHLAKERALRDNAQWGDWNDDQLAEMVYRMAADGSDVKLLGIEEDELARLLGIVGVGGGTEGLTDPDEIPEAVEPRSKRGDLWLLGEHRVLCGDSTSATDVGRLADGRTVDLCFTSPPYAQQRDYGAVIRDWDALMIGVFGSLPVSESAQVIVNLGMVHRDGEWWPYWEAWIEWMRTQGWRRFGWYVWDQMRGLPGDWNGRLAPSFEFIFHFNRQSIRPVKHVATNVERAKRERDQVARGHIKTGLRSSDGSVNTLTSPGAVGQTHKVPDNVLRLERHMANDIARLNHPATFPVSLPTFIAKSWPGDVYDPFLGSGTTLIACEQLGRRCYGLEIEPKYVDVIVQRWENFAGKTAELVDARG